MLRKFVYCSKNTGFKFLKFSLGKWLPGNGLAIRHRNGSLTFLGGIAFPLIPAEDPLFQTMVWAEGENGPLEYVIWETPNNSGIWIPDVTDDAVKVYPEDEEEHVQAFIDAGFRLFRPGIDKGEEIFTTAYDNLFSLMPPRWSGVGRVLEDRFNYWFEGIGDFHKPRWYRISKDEIKEMVFFDKEIPKIILHQQSLEMENDRGAVDEFLFDQIQRWFSRTEWSWEELESLNLRDHVRRTENAELPPWDEFPEKVTFQGVTVHRPPDPYELKRGECWHSYFHLWSQVVGSAPNGNAPEKQRLFLALRGAASHVLSGRDLVAFSTNGGETC